MDGGWSDRPRDSGRWGPALLLQLREHRREARCLHVGQGASGRLFATFPLLERGVNLPGRMGRPLRSSLDRADALLGTLGAGWVRGLLGVASLGRSSPGASALVHLGRQKGLPGEFLPSAIQSLASSPGPGTRLFAAQQQELLAPAARRWPLEKLLAARPDAARGKSLFQKARCNTCHIVRGEGTDFGPELSDIGTRLTSQQLFAAILNPSQTISLGYEGGTIGLENGSLLNGFVTSESETSVGLRIQGGLLKDLFKADIRTRKAMGISLMPAAIDATLAPQDLVDLVGWLKTLQARKANKR